MARLADQWASRPFCLYLPMFVCIGISHLLSECEGSTLMFSCLHSRDLVTHLPRASLSQFIIFVKVLIIYQLILPLKSALLCSAHSSLHQSWAYSRDKRLSSGMRWPGFFSPFLFPATRLFKSKLSAAESLEIEGGKRKPLGSFTDLHRVQSGTLAVGSRNTHVNGFPSWPSYFGK